MVEDMPLFKCVECGCLENTALADYWYKEGRKRPLTCSACDPNIAQWHGKFTKETPEEAGYKKRPDGFYEPEFLQINVPDRG